jgi:hypothetical protein
VLYFLFYDFEFHILILLCGFYLEAALVSNYVMATTCGTFRMFSMGMFFSGYFLDEVLVKLVMLLLFSSNFKYLKFGGVGVIFVCYSMMTGDLY